jgi:hypothetical protein
MSTHPIDVITEIVGPAAYAQDFAAALADERIVAHAAQALFDAGWTPSPDDEDAKAIAATVLRSVSGDA